MNRQFLVDDVIVTLLEGGVRRGSDMAVLNGWLLAGCCALAVEQPSPDRSDKTFLQPTNEVIFFGLDEQLISIERKDSVDELVITEAFASQLRDMIQRQLSLFKKIGNRIVEIRFYDLRDASNIQHQAFVYQHELET